METQIAHLFDIGIMPLVDEPFQRGKCGCKILQYMSASLPVVASRVGINTELIEHGSRGLLASGKEEWHEALATLIAAPELRRAMGQSGRDFVGRHYSINDVVSAVVVRHPVRGWRGLTPAPMILGGSSNVCISVSAGRRAALLDSLRAEAIVISRKSMSPKRKGGRVHCIARGVWNSEPLEHACHSRCLSFHGERDETRARQSQQGRRAGSRDLFLQQTSKTICHVLERNCTGRYRRIHRGKRRAHSHPRAEFQNHGSGAAHPG